MRPPSTSHRTARAWRWPGRKAERTHAVAAETGGTPFVADFDSLDEVQRLASELLKRYSSIDVLANNAGGLVSKRGLTKDGYERTFQHNHLAPFLLTNLLLERLGRSRGRVISTSSAANLIGRLDLDDLDWSHRVYGGGWGAYGTSKLETIMFIKELARREPTLSAYSFHPGYVSTAFGSGSALVRLGNTLSGVAWGARRSRERLPSSTSASVSDLGVRAAPTSTASSRWDSHAGWRRTARPRRRCGSSAPSASDWRREPHHRDHRRELGCRQGRGDRTRPPTAPRWRSSAATPNARQRSPRRRVAPHSWRTSENWTRCAASRTPCLRVTRRSTCSRTTRVDSSSSAGSRPTASNSPFRPTTSPRYCSPACCSPGWPRVRAR